MAETIQTVIAVLVSLFLASAAAYFDISFFFKEKKIGVGSIVRQPASMRFLLGNGLIAVAILAWSLVGGENAAINKLLGHPNQIVAGIAIGLSVPLLIRSKWFSIAKEDGSRPAGVEALYDGIRGNVLHSINTWSIALKNRISRDFAAKLANESGLPEKLLDIVTQETKPFLSEADEKEMIEEFKRYEAAFKKSGDHSDYLEKLFRWAMDWCGIDPIRRHLDDLALRRA